MRYLSVCSGIEAASVAWHHLGWEPVGFSEIEPFPAAVLAHRFPNVPNFGDMTKYEQWPLQPGSIDLLVGGTPCQSFSVAGLRKGLEDPRGNLMLTYLAIAARFRPRWVVWENVPGVLSSNGGRDFGTFLGALGELGYGWAYRVLDAQYMRVGRWPRAVPQRRRRVFVVGRLIERGAGDWTAAAEALALREGLQRHLEAGGKARQGAAPDAEGRAGGGCWPARVASTLNHAFGDKLGLEDQHALHGAPLFVPDAVGALTAKGPTAMGAPEVDANGAQRMPDKDNLGAVLQPTAGTLGNRGLRSHTELDGHGAYIPVAIQAGATRENPASGPDGIGVRTDGVAYTIEARAEVQAVAQPVPIQDGREIEKRQNGLGIGQPGDPAYTVDTTAAQAVGQPVPYDLFQITAPVNRQNRKPGDPCHTLARDNAAHAAVAVGFNWQNGGGYGNANDGLGITVEGTGPLQRCNTPAVSQAMTVRRLSARECERLQGFPDDWTLIPWRKKPAEECPDGPRYKALGNSMACNCMAWIGERIAAWEAAR